MQMPRRKQKREQIPPNPVDWSFVLRYNSVSIYDSAFKHGIHSYDIIHAHTHAVAFFEFSSSYPERKLLVIGSDTAGNLLELIGVVKRDEFGICLDEIESTA
jgi:hypothetical protein